MGRIAESLIATFQAQAEELQQVAEQFTGGLPADMPSPQELAEQGYDPQHVLYIAAQNFASLFGESACELEEFEPYAEAAEQAEDEYMPSSPPMSPITSSFFYTWSLFDLRFGVDQETVGSCLLELMRSMEAPEDMLAVLEKYCNSRMGIYEHLGEQAGKVRLRELVTGDEIRCHSTSGYRGKKNELWYVRLCPPVNDEFDYHVAVTTPYVLTESSAEDWTAFLTKHLIAAEDKRQALHDLLKFGSDSVHWMEFVFQAYHHYQFDAIFLAGIPDVAVSLPHSPVHDESEDDSHPASCEMVNVRLSEAQRKAIADMCPELAPRLRLSEKHQRTIGLQSTELKDVVAAAEKDLLNTKGPRRNTLKKIIELTRLPQPWRIAPPLVRRATTIYQFKITLAGSKPPIWRRIQVEDCPLAAFHYHIQAAMGWHDSHLHEFNIAGERYAAPPPFTMGPDDFDAIDASTVVLSELIGGQKKFRCEYLYDFGDGWEHKIELEDICAAEAKAKYPRCTGGARACPPEDCGGIWGFYDFVAAMSDRKHPEHRDLKEWYGGPFKPDAFDERKATREMRQWS